MIFSMTDKTFWTKLLYETKFLWDVRPGAHRGEGLGVGLPYKSNGAVRWKFWKQPLRDTKIHFCVKKIGTNSRALPSRFCQCPAFNKALQFRVFTTHTLFPLSAIRLRQDSDLWLNFGLGTDCVFIGFPCSSTSVAISILGCLPLLSASRMW